MFTALIRKKGSYMALAALAVLAVAALATLLQASPAHTAVSSNAEQPDQVKTSRLVKYSATTLTFIN